MEYIVAGLIAAFALVILVVLFRRSARDRTSNASPDTHPSLGVQHYAGQGDIIRYTGSGGLDGGGEGGDGGGGGGD